MSPHGQQAALQLTLPSKAHALVEVALGKTAAASAVPQGDAPGD
jgi:hypothetical protein